LTIVFTSTVNIPGSKEPLRRYVISGKPDHDGMMGGMGRFVTIRAVNDQKISLLTSQN